MGMDLEFHIEQYNPKYKWWDFIDTESYGRNSELYEMLKKFGYSGRELPEDLTSITKSWLDDNNYYSYGWFSIYDFKSRLYTTKSITRTGYLSFEQYYALIRHDQKPRTWNKCDSDLTPIQASWETDDLHCLTSLNEMINIIAKRNEVEDMTEWGLMSRVIYILV